MGITRFSRRFWHDGKSRLFALGAAAVVLWSQGVSAGAIQFAPATSLFPAGPTEEVGPSLSSDGLTLYFQRGNPGAYDIWTATSVRGVQECPPYCQRDDIRLR
jgi:hypothetical protein